MIVDLKQDAPVTVADAASPDVGLPDLGPVAPMTWKTIPSGTFTMGSPEDELCRDVGPVVPKETQHEVTLSRSFKICATEVSRGQFWELMGYDPALANDLGSLNCGLDCAALVKWAEAAAYCVARSAKEGLAACYRDISTKKACKYHTDCNPSLTHETCIQGKCGAYEVSPAYDGTTKSIYDCPGYRLPTEAEWEYAYRAGTTTAFYNGPITTPECNVGSSDPNADKIAWYSENSGSTVHPVSQKAPNAWGLYDMAGNAMEWCHDPGEMDLGTAPVTDPCGASPGIYRMCRGGDYTTAPPLLRAAFRLNRDMSGLAGFRCVLSITP